MADVTAESRQFSSPCLISLKKNPFPTVPTSLLHNPGASTVLIFLHAYGSDIKEQLCTRSGFLCLKGASASAKYTKVLCLLLQLQDNYSQRKSSIMVVHIFFEPSFPGTGGPWRVLQWGRIHMNKLWKPSQLSQATSLSSREKLLQWSFSIER